MYMFLGVVGFLSTIGLVIAAIVQAIRRKPSWKKLLGFAALAFAVFMFGAVNDSSTPSTSSSTETASTQSDASTPAQTAEASKPEPPPPPKPDLEIIDHKWVTGEYSSSIVGHVRNNTDHEYSYAQVEINLYDSNGNQVGSTFANVNNLEPGGTWKFEAPILEDSATKARIKDVTGF